MKITIDTSHDSKEEIRKAVEFLSRLLEMPAQHDSADFNVPEQAGSAMQMFDTDKKDKEKPSVQMYDV